MSLLSCTFQDETTYPGRRGGGRLRWHGPIPAPQCPTTTRINEQSRFCWRMNEGGSLVCMLLELESRGLLPLVTPAGSAPPCRPDTSSHSTQHRHRDARPGSSLHCEGFFDRYRADKGSLWQRLETQREAFLHTRRTAQQFTQGTKDFIFSKSREHQKYCAASIITAKHNYWQVQNIRWSNRINDHDSKFFNQYTDFRSRPRLGLCIWT